MARRHKVVRLLRLGFYLGLAGAAAVVNACGSSSQTQVKSPTDGGGDAGASGKAGAGGTSGAGGQAGAAGSAGTGGTAGGTGGTVGTGGTGGAAND